MSVIDDILKLIGLTTVILICLALVFGILSYAYGTIVGLTSGVKTGITDQYKAEKALQDYNYKLDLVKEQTQRIDMYYAAKTSTSLTQIEFRSWLGTIRGLTDEFIDRENNATEAGEAYLGCLSPNSDEYNRVRQNELTTNDDIKKIKDTYNGNVYIYNHQYGTISGYVAYLQ